MDAMALLWQVPHQDACAVADGPLRTYRCPSFGSKISFIITITNYHYSSTFIITVIN